MTPAVKTTPRRINFNNAAIASLANDTSPPAPDSVALQLWDQCKPIAYDALNTPYIQGIAKGNLPPDNYGQYTIQDAAYCVNGQDDYLEMYRRALMAGEFDIACFAMARYESYLKYTDSILKSWHLASSDCIKPNHAVQQYIAHEHIVACNLPPIYGIVAMIPCERLWSWLAEQLAPYNTQNNVYSFWIEENTGWSGTYRLENFVNAWVAINPGEFNIQLAQQIYTNSMQCEVKDFLASYPPK